jgi:hypothetical protein
MAVGVPSEDCQILAVHATAQRDVADYGAVRDFGRPDPMPGTLAPPAAKDPTGLFTAMILTTIAGGRNQRIERVATEIVAAVN